MAWAGLVGGFAGRGDGGGDPVERLGSVVVGRGESAEEREGVAAFAGRRGRGRGTQGLVELVGVVGLVAESVDERGGQSCGERVRGNVRRSRLTSRCR